MSIAARSPARFHLAGRLLPATVALVGLAATSAPLRAQSCSPTNLNHWCVDVTTLGGTAFPDNLFGAALAFGDFDGDGDDDLAVGIPGAGSTGIAGSGTGSVQVFYSDGTALALAGRQGLSQLNLAGSADGGPESGDQFGAALASGDFDGDGFADLAVGSPGESVLEASASDCTGVACVEAGGVTIVYGSAAGLDLQRSEFFHAGDLTGIFGDGPRDGDGLGAALAVGDFDAQGDADDLAAGAPRHASAPGFPLRGEVFVAFGSPTGLTHGDGGYVLGFDGIEPPCQAGIRHLGQALASGRFEPDGTAELLVGAPLCPLSGAAGVGAVFVYGLPTILSVPTVDLVQTDFSGGSNVADDHFANALVVADFDADGIDDLAVAAADKNHGAGSPSNSGLVYVAYGSTSGSGPDPADRDLVGEELWSGQTPQAGDQFGFAIAAGDVDGDGFPDLVVGTPGQGAEAGFIYLERGSSSGLTATGNRVISQGFVGGVNEANDRFGEVLAVGDVDGDGVLELAIGVPKEDVGSTLDAGMVYVTRVFDASWTFYDGFESGDRGAWSRTSP